MRFQLQTSVFSLGYRYSATDKLGKRSYLLAGKFFSISDRLAICDAEGKEVGSIRQQHASISTRFCLYRGEQYCASVTQKLVSIKRKFLLEIPGQESKLVIGNFGNYEKLFKNGEQIVASVLRKRSSFGSRYIVDVDEGQDEFLMLGVTAMVDLICPVHAFFVVQAAVPKTESAKPLTVPENLPI